MIRELVDFWETQDSSTKLLGPVMEKTVGDQQGESELEPIDLELHVDGRAETRRDGHPRRCNV